MEIIDKGKVSKKLLSNSIDVKFVNPDFEIINDTNEEINLDNLTINNDVNLEYSFKDIKIKVKTLFIYNIKDFDLDFIKNISKYIDFKFLIIYDKRLRYEKSYIRTGKDYISLILYYLYLQDLSLDNVLINGSHYSIKYINENYDLDVFDTEENRYFYENLIFSKNLRLIKGTYLVAHSITFLSDGFVIDDDIKFKNLKELTINDSLELEQAFSNLENKIESYYVLKIKCQNYLNLDFYRNLVQYINFDKVTKIEFYDVNNTSLNYESFISMLKEMDIPIDKCQFHASDVENEKIEIKSDTLYRYKNQEKEYHVPDGIKSIDYGAFLQDTKIDVLYLPSTLEEVRGICNDNIKKIVCAKGSAFKILMFLGSTWLVLTDEDLIVMHDIESLLYNKVIEINVLEDISNLLNYIPSLTYNNNLSANKWPKIIINSPYKLTLREKRKLKKVFRNKFNEKIEIIFNIVDRKENENISLNEQVCPDDLVDEEIKELIKELEKKKSLLKKDDQETLNILIKKLLDQYLKDLKNIKPNLKSSLKENINFGKKTPEELKLNLIISLNNLLSSFVRKDYEKLISDLKKYQTLLNNNSLSLKDDASIENKINNILYIANMYHSLIIKDKLTLLISNTLDKAQEYFAKDMDEAIELVLQNYSNLNNEFNNDINELYENVLEYQKNRQAILDLYHDLDLNTGSDFSLLLNKFKEKIEIFSDALIKDLFKSTLDEYKKYLLGILNTFPSNENIDEKYIQECLRYSLSPLELYLIQNNGTNITTYQIINSLRNSLKIINNENDVDNDYLAIIVLEIENKCLELNKYDKDIIDNELKSILNKWLNYLNNGNIKSKQRFNNLELNVLYLIIKDLVYLSINIDGYINNKNNYDKAIKNLRK